MTRNRCCQGWVDRWPNCGGMSKGYYLVCVPRVIGRDFCLVTLLIRVNMTSHDRTGISGPISRQQPRWLSGRGCYHKDLAEAVTPLSRYRVGQHGRTLLRSLASLPHTTLKNALQQLRVPPILKRRYSYHTKIDTCPPGHTDVKVVYGYTKLQAHIRLKRLDVPQQFGHLVNQP